MPRLLCLRCRELLADAQQRLAEARAALGAAVAAEGALGEERRELQRALDASALERSRALRQRDDALLKLGLMRRQREGSLTTGGQEQGGYFGAAAGPFGAGMSDVDAAAMSRLQTLLRVQ